MSKRWILGAAALAAALVLAACGEKRQEIGTGSGPDTPAYEGTGVANFTSPGWKAGDRNSWAQELRARGQYGQNEYTRTTR